MGVNVAEDEKETMKRSQNEGNQRVESRIESQVANEGKMLRHHTLMLETVVLKVDVTKIENLHHPKRREVNPEIKMIVNPNNQRVEEKKEMMMMGATLHLAQFQNLKSTAARKAQCVIKSLIKGLRSKKMIQQFLKTTS